jgi:C-terminal processing protease CtpA/Prc
MSAEFAPFWLAKATTIPLNYRTILDSREIVMELVRRRPARSGIAALFFCICFATFCVSVSAQKLTDLDRDLGRTMAKFVKEDIKKYYYDPNFHGVDLDARFASVEKDIQAAQTRGDIFGSIAQAVSELNDSHTLFYPPEQTAQSEYGWEMSMIGNRCFVVAVKPGSGAETQGLRAGDEVLQVDQFTLSRPNMWRFRYLYYSLAPRGGMHLVVRAPDGQRKELNIPAKVTETKILVRGANDYYEMIRERQTAAKLYGMRYYENLDDVFVWQLPSFQFSTDQMDEMMAKVHKHKALILDLRGNPGGYVLSLERLLGYFFAKDTKFADLHQRKETKPHEAKSRGADKIFTGQLVVLVDSSSASCAELFVRVIQLEKRGTVIGDRSSGMVMESEYHPRQTGLDYAIFYGTTVADGDFVMNDGKSLEGVGITPDKMILPTAADLAAQRDPALAYAASQVGLTLTPEKAGTLFPWQWKK